MGLSSNLSMDIRLSRHLNVNVGLSSRGQLGVGDRGIIKASIQTTIGSSRGIGSSRSSIGSTSISTIAIAKTSISSASITKSSRSHMASAGGGSKSKNSNEGLHYERVNCYYC